MTTMLIACNATRESGSFMGDQLCLLKTCYLFVQNAPDVDRVIVSMSRANEMHFLWERFLRDPRGDGGIPPVEVVWDDWDPGNWTQRWNAWNRWRTERAIEGRPFDHYRECYLRIHGTERQTVLCGSERGLGRRNIYEYWLAGQENCPDHFPGADWFDDTLIDHPLRSNDYDVWISPHAKTQGNYVFTFAFWEDVTRRLLVNGLAVTVGYDRPFCPDMMDHPLYRRVWGDHRAWMEEICRHRVVACGNTGTGWLAAACGVPMITMEPHNSIMADHRYRECGLRNIVEVVDGYKLDELDNDMGRVADYVARRIAEQVTKCVVMTTGCYDVLHAGHVRHLQRARALGTKLIVALNSDASVRKIKGTVEGVARPINPEAQRKAVLEELRSVDEVRLFDGETALDLIREIRPDVLACGFGYTPDTIVGREEVQAYGGRVVVTCAGDAADEPSTTKIVRRSRRADIVSAVRAAQGLTVNPPAKLLTLAEEFATTTHLEGDVADCGTCRGGTAVVLRRLAPDKRLHLFDTWAGNPHDDPLCHHKRGEWAASLEDCRRAVGNGELTHYWPGVFPKSAEDNGLWLPRYCFVFVDMDTEQATADAVRFFWPRLVPGGKMVFDDWAWEPCAGVEKALRGLFVVDQLRPIGNMCVVEKR